MGINLGATIAPLICGYVGQRINWHLGFALSGLGMTFGVIQYWLGRRHLADAGLHPVPAANFAAAASQRRLLRNALFGVVVIGCALAFVHLTGLLPLTPVLLVNAAGVVLLAIVVALFAWMLLGGDWTPVERKRLGAILVLFVAASIFWAAYEQAGSSLSLFAERSSNNVVLHFNFPASWYQSLNSLFIVALAPLIAWLWIRLGNRQPSSPAKFALGLLFVGLGFVVLVFGALLSAHGARVSPLFLVLTYLLHTIRRAVPQPGRTQRHHQARARACRQLHDGRLVHLHLHRRLPRRAPHVLLWRAAGAGPVRHRGRYKHPGGHRSVPGRPPCDATHGRRTLAPISRGIK